MNVIELKNHNQNQIVHKGVKWMKLIKSLAQNHREKMAEKVNEIISDTDVIVYGESLCGKHRYIFAYHKLKKELYILDYSGNLEYKVVNNEKNNISMNDDVLSVNIDNIEHLYVIPFLKLNGISEPVLQIAEKELFQTHINYAHQVSSRIN